MDPSVGFAAALGGSLTAVARRRAFQAYKEHYNEELARGKKRELEHQQKIQKICCSFLGFCF
jgi:hypothetical protein